MITNTLETNKLDKFLSSPANISQGHQNPDIDKYLIEQIECGCQNAMRILYHKYYMPLTSLINSCTSLLTRSAAYNTCGKVSSWHSDIRILFVR